MIMTEPCLYLNRSLRRKQKMASFQRQCFWSIQLLALFIVTIQTADSNSDWLETCRICHCNWNSGKKTADCKGKDLTALPDEMSSELQVIDLSNNMIAELQRDAFLEANFQNLHKLYMRNCTIQELNRDAFKGLVILIELDLSQNSISVLRSGTFAGLTKLRNVVMNHNEIEVLEDYLFDDLPSLLRVELKFNRLTQIGSHTFGQLPMLIAIDLEGNKLKTLRKDTFNRLPKLKSLTLAQNIWNCSCDLKELRDFTIANRLYTPPTNCHDPLHLRGKLWNEVPSENFACRPRILGSIRTFIEVQSDNITLPCRVEGSPLPNVTWMYNKRPINANDYHLKVLNSFEQNQFDYHETNIFTSELRIYGVKSSDKGVYTCIAENRGGKGEAEIHLLVNGDYLSAMEGINGNVVIGASASDTQSNILFVICLILTIFLILLIIVVLVICRYCGRMRTNQKDATIIRENGLIPNKIERTHNCSIKEGSVIMEMQKSLLTEVNPVEKPPRRSELENSEVCDDGHEMKETLLEDTQFGNPYQRDDETHSIAFSDTIAPRSGRNAYIEENYGRSLPPDLLAFPARVPPTSPTMQSSQSNIPEQVIYGIRSPILASPVYAHMTPHGIYGTTTLAAASPNGFMTLQHPKSRNLAMIATANSRQQQQQQSPFVPAPIVYSPTNNAAIVMKQGYMTIPRKPRIPSWASSTVTAANTTQFSDLQSPTSSNFSEVGTSMTLDLQSEPVYDNLGLRTTAGGNSILNLHKPQLSELTARYTMRDRPLPATPSLTSVASNSNTGVIPQQPQQHNYHHSEPMCPTTTVSLQNNNTTVSKIYEPIHEFVNHLQSTTTSDTEPLYGTARNHSNLTIVPSANAATTNTTEIPKVTKIPPRPPPKPKKKISVTTIRTGQGSTSQLFDDECEDGTEV